MFKLSLKKYLSSSSIPQNRPYTNYSRQRTIVIKPRFKSSVKFKKYACRFSDKKQLVDFAVVKELDEETNLYYYGARYLDPRTSRWIAGDPAIWQGDYIPVAPVNDEARKHNQNLPGMGGIFNIVNMHAYHYAGNNPVKYVDPDGRSDSLYRVDIRNQNGGIGRYNTIRYGNGVVLVYWIPNPPVPTPSPIASLSERVLMGTNGVSSDGPCLAMSYLGIAQTYTGRTLTPEQINTLLSDPLVFNKSAGAADYIIKAAIKELNVNIDVTKLEITDERLSNRADPTAYATIRMVDGVQDSSSGHHFQQGSNTGELVWDPLHGTTDSYSTNPTYIRNIYIREIE